MTLNIEERTEAAVTKYEGAADKIEQFSETDSIVPTGSGNRKSFPMLSREIEEDALKSFRLGASNRQGTYAVGATYDEPNWTYTYNGQQWGLSDDFDLSLLPYETTQVDPNDDDNLSVYGSASTGYVNQAQGEVIEGSIYPEYGFALSGDEIAEPCDFLRLLGFGLVSIYPKQRSGLISNYNPVTRTIQIGGQVCIFSKVETSTKIPAGRSAFQGNSSVQNQEHNTLASDLDASHVNAGTYNQPNRIGQEVFFDRLASDGVQVNYPVSVGFVVNEDPGFVNIRVAEIAETGVRTPIVGFTITGYGTSSITITIPVAIVNTSELEVAIIGESELLGTGADLASILGGYDNVNNGLMSSIQGAHSIIDGCTHATIMGGSFIRLINAGDYIGAAGTGIYFNGICDGTFGFGTSLTVENSRGSLIYGSGNFLIDDYATVGGLGCIAGRYAGADGFNCHATGTGSKASGSGVVVSGTYSWSHGLGNTISKDYSGGTGRDNASTRDYGFFSGREHQIDFDYCNAEGLGALVRNAGSSARGHAEVGGAKGSRQTTKITVKRQTTDGSTATMQDLAGASSIKFGENAAAYVKGKCVAYNTDGTECASFDIDALLRLTTGVAVLVYDNTSQSGGDAGAAAWTLFIQATTNGFFVRPTGEAAKTIEWFAEIEVLEVSSVL